MAWVCPMCSTNNVDTDSQCIVCDTIKPEDKPGLKINSELKKINYVKSNISSDESSESEEAAKYDSAVHLMHLNPTKGFEKLLNCATGGYVEAQCRVGLEYYTGKIVSKDYAKAITWFTKAAFQGDVVAQYYLGLCHVYGDKKNYNSAFLWFTKAAEASHVGAQLYVAHCYAYGWGVEIDHVTAVSWYRKAASDGNSTAMYYLGSAYFNGRGIEKNETKAFLYFDMAAKAGNVDAEVYLGYCYEKGCAVAVDMTRAVQHYLAAAEAGNASAQYNIGLCYKNGKGVKADRSVAIKWFSKAAAQGHKKSIAMLEKI